MAGLLRGAAALFGPDAPLAVLARDAQTVGDELAAAVEHVGSGPVEQFCNRHPRILMLPTGPGVASGARLSHTGGYACGSPDCIEPGYSAGFRSPEDREVHEALWARAGW